MDFDFGLDNVPLALVIIGGFFFFFVGIMIGYLVFINHFASGVDCQYSVVNSEKYCTVTSEECVMTGNSVTCVIDNTTRMACSASKYICDDKVYCNCSVGKNSAITVSTKK